MMSPPLLRHRLLPGRPKTDIPDELSFKAEYLADAPEWINPGDSVIVDPDGKVVAGPAHAVERSCTRRCGPIS